MVYWPGDDLQVWVNANIERLEYLMNHMEPRPESIKHLLIEILSGGVEALEANFKEEDITPKAVSIKNICPKCGSICDTEVE
jgi:hypothetical protein